MAQKIADHVQRGTPTHHLCGKAMAELMGATVRCTDVGKAKRAANNASDAPAIAESAVGCPGTKKHASAVASGPAVAQIVGNRLTNGLRQRKRGPLAAFGAYVQRPSVPLNVIEFEKGHFTRAQPQSSEEQENGVVAPSQGGTPIHTGQQLTIARQSS